MLLPALVVVLAVLLGAGAYGVADVRAEEAARLAARSAARGEGAERAEAVAREVLGAEGSVSVSFAGGQATVVVRRPAPGVIGAWGGPPVVARASARAEEPGDAP